MINKSSRVPPAPTTLPQVNVSHWLSLCWSFWEIIDPQMLIPNMQLCVCEKKEACLWEFGGIHVSVLTHRKKLQHHLVWASPMSQWNDICTCQAAVAHTQKQINRGRTCMWESIRLQFYGGTVSWKCLKGTACLTNQWKTWMKINHVCCRECWQERNICFSCLWPQHTTNLTTGNCRDVSGL